MSTSRSISIRINGQEVENSIKSIAKESRILTAQLSKLTIGSEEYNQKAGELRRVRGIIQQHNQTLRETGEAWNKAGKGANAAGASLLDRAKGIGIAAAAAFSVGHLVMYGQELFRTASMMELNANKAATVLGPALAIVEAKAREQAAAMGLTQQAYVANTTAIADLLIPMGFTREVAAGLSTDMVGLAGALSEWTGGQFNAKQVSESLSKALLGSREELNRYGIDLKESEVANRLAEKGMAGLTGQLLKQAQAAATMELILEKSTDAQNAYAEGAGSMVRRSAELQARLSSLYEALATQLIPVFESLMGVAESGARGLETLSKGMQSLLDPTGRAANAFQDQKSKVASLEKNLVPLLNRYDELKAKTNPTAAEQAELAKLIAEVGKQAPGAVTAIDNYGVALSISAGKAREFIEAERARLAFVNKESITTIEREIDRMKARRQEMQATIAAGRERTLPNERVPTSPFASDEDVRRNVSIELSDQRRAQIMSQTAKLAAEILGAETELARLKGETKAPEVTPPPTTGGEDPEARKKLLAEEARQRAEARAKETEERQAQLEQLRQMEADNRQRLFEDSLEDDERKLEQIRRSYDDRIALANELEAKGSTESGVLRLALEQQLDQELTAYRTEIGQREAERQQKLADEALEQWLANEERMNEARIESEQRKADLLAELAVQDAETVGLGIEVVSPEQKLADETARMIIAAEEQYQALREAAEQHNAEVAFQGEGLTIDLESIERSRQERLLAIQKAGGEKGKQLEKELAVARLQAQSQALQALGSAFGSIADSIAAKTQQGLAFKRAATLAQIAFDTAAGISSAVASSIGQPFPANIIAVASSVSLVLANIARARAALSEGAVPQYYEGGATGEMRTVRGAKDGRSYRARYVGTPVSGMLSAGPKLVLANERGPEYFVAAKDLQNPAIFDAVSFIEGIKGGRRRVEQYYEGGPTGILQKGENVVQMPSAASGGGMSEEAIAMLARVSETLDRLTSELESGLHAVVGDQTILAIQSRVELLNRVTGRR